MGGKAWIFCKSKKMAKNLLSKKLLFLVLFILFLYLVIFFAKIGERTLARMVVSKIAENSIRCDTLTPNWMPMLLKEIIQKDDILTNQIVYIDSQRNKYSCISSSSIFKVKNTNYDTRFRYASLTKVLTHYAILDLAKQKKINLEENFIKYFPELHDFKDQRIKKIKVIDLLQHRAGFDFKQSQDPFFDFKKKPWCPYNIHYLTKIKLDYDPDKQYQYDNRNTCLLGALIERITGKSLREYFISQYDLNTYNVKFSEGNSFVDEVKYDYINSYFIDEKMIKKIDFYALSAVGGLTGSAQNLAQLLHTIFTNSDLDVFAISEKAATQCQLNNFKTCNGVVFRSYQKSEDLPKMYYRIGSLGPASSLLAVTEKKEIIVWVGNGFNRRIEQHFIDQYLYEHVIRE
ncbi:serine hydrolase [Acinetobacter sp. YH12054]|uniref:serine hydrolase domain-containing protein n=1 Tax=Acinetobacter sp. YH12054 TaxID=2601056 RepID=UPI0015D1F2CF|nr:serine hydrolase domain-containing protein [Acinetobacter sp. YH12054]